MKLSEIIKQYRSINKISMREFAKKCGVSNAYISLIESEDTKSPTLEMIAKLAKGMCMQMNDLIDMMNDDVVVTVKSKNISIRENDMSNVIPVYKNITFGISPKIEDRLDDIPVPDKLAKKKDLFGLKMSEDGMNKVIPVKSIAVFQRCTELNKEDIGLFTINEQDAIVRYYYKLKDGCLLEPASYNDEHVALIIGKDKMDNVKILGRFVWYCMDLNEKL